MNRRRFLGAGLAPLAFTLPARGATYAPRRVSLAAQRGMFPNVPLIAHDGRRVNFYEDLIQGDRIVLINFFLLRCRDGLCPVSIYNLTQTQQLLGDRIGRDIFFYSITLAPETDRPDLLRAYAEAFGVKPGWLFLTGAPAGIEKLRRALGYVDTDPERDKDKSNHINVARYGNDALERWAAVSTQSTPDNIATALRFLKV